MPHGDEGLVIARRTVMAFQDAPLHLLAAQEGKAIRAWLSEWTGLSPARIGQGNLDNLRQSRLDRIEDHARQKAKKIAEWSDDELDTRQRSLRLENGETGLWASWVAGVVVDPSTDIPYTLDIALNVDRLLQRLAVALQADDAKEVGLAVRRCAATSRWSDSNQAQSGESGAAGRAADGEDVSVIVSSLIEEAFYDLMSALDAEWGGTYFGKLSPAPVFLWVAPRVNPDLVLGQRPKTKRNLMFRPVRRLLEISHALVHYGTTGDWPSSAAGAAEIGQACTWGERGIANLFDGTRKLTLKSYLSLWNGLCADLVRRKQVPSVECPVPLAAMAITFQRFLVQTTDEHKWRSFVVLDEQKYTSLWSRHRKNLAGQRPPGAVGWPAWLVNQSLASDSMRSSQLS